VVDVIVNADATIGRGSGEGVSLPWFCLLIVQHTLHPLVRLLSSGNWLLPRGHHSTLTPAPEKLKLKAFSVRRRTSQQRFRSFAVAQRPRDDACLPPTIRSLFALFYQVTLAAGLVPSLWTRTLPIAVLDLPLTAENPWLHDLTSCSFRRILQ
jgi:hypothetical protein